MVGKRDFDEAISNGLRNRDTMPLISNWCANARVAGMGYGLLAQQTGLPIGHHGLSCDYAAEDGGSFFYELSDAAIDFYDRNCKGCAHRKGGRLPNILERVAARDREREKQAAEAAKDAAVAEAALAARDEERRLLRQGLSPVAQTLVDDIGAYDRDRSEENLGRLMHSAEMAPEHFAKPLADYIFKVLETSNWLDAAGLEMLAAIEADPVRLAKVAARVLAKGGHRDLGARILIPRVVHLDGENAKSATPGAIDLAYPDRESLIGMPYRDPQPDLLNLLYEHHREAVDQAVAMLLDSKSSYGVERAGRGLSALLDRHPAAATVHARTLISSFVRAGYLLSDFDEMHELYAVAKAVIGAFEADPEGIDAMLQDFAVSSGSSGRKRTYDLYARALHAGFDKKLPADSQRARIAFRRLLWATTGEFDADLFEIAAPLFRHGGRDLELVATAEIDAVLAAPFLLADRLRSLEEAPLDPKNPLAAIERGSHRSSVTAVMDGLIELAARAVFQDRALLPKIGEFLAAIPDDREMLKGIAVGGLARLASDVAGLELYLPHLYRAMVGPSAIERSYAATAFGELTQSALDNVPTLLFEAFGLLLLDTHVIVHKAAARAFRKSLLPDPYRRNALWAMYQLVRIYRTESGEDHFVAECVKTLAGSADEFGKQASALRGFLIETCMGIDPLFLRSDLRRLSHSLGDEPEFAKLVTRMLPHLAERYNRNDTAERILERLPSATILAYEHDFEEVGRRLATTEQWLTLVVIDTLARAGAGAAAARVARARIDALDDIPRNRNVRLFARLVDLAFRFEQAVADGAAGETELLAAEWAEIEKALKDHREEARERDRRSHLPVPH
jgi:hypothetical protein